MATAISATTGSIIFAMATFDVNSVNIEQTQHTQSKMKSGENVLSPLIELPIIDDMPVTLPPSANANPPPNKNINPHGMVFSKYGHVISASDATVGSVTKNSPFLISYGVCSS